MRGPSNHTEGTARETRSAGRKSIAEVVTGSLRSRVGIA